MLISEKQHLKTLNLSQVGLSSLTTFLPNQKKKKIYESKSPTEAMIIGCPAPVDRPKSSAVKAARETSTQANGAFRPSENQQ